MEVLGVLAATGVDGSDFVLVLTLKEDVHATSIRWYYITTDLCVASSTILNSCILKLQVLFLHLKLFNIFN